MEGSGNKCYIGILTRQESAVKKKREFCARACMVQARVQLRYWPLRPGCGMDIGECDDALVANQFITEWLREASMNRLLTKCGKIVTTRG